MTQKQLEHAGRKWQKRMLLSHWGIAWVGVHDCYVNNEACYADCLIDTNTLTATVRIAVEHPDDEVLSTMKHELIHIVLSPLKAAIQGTIIAALSDDAATIATNVITIEDERAVRSLERIIATK